MYKTAVGVLESFVRTVVIVSSLGKRFDVKLGAYHNGPDFS
jgi:hypothetical protein